MRRSGGPFPEKKRQQGNRRENGCKEFEGHKSKKNWVKRRVYMIRKGTFDR